MFLAKKSPRVYVVLYHKFLHKRFIIADTSSPKHYSHTSPDAKTAVSGPKIIVLCAPQESTPIYSGQCAFPKHPANTSIPSDTPRPFTRSRFLLFHDCSRVDLPLCQDVYVCPEGGSRWRRLWQRACPSSTTDPEFDRPIIFPRGVQLSLAFSAPPIRQKKLYLSGIRGCSLMVKWNQTPRMFL